MEKTVAAIAWIEPGQALLATRAQYHGNKLRIMRTRNLGCPFLCVRRDGNLSQVWQLSQCKKHKYQVQPAWKRNSCRSGLEEDAPFAVAIGASILTTLLLPVDRRGQSDNADDSVLGGDDIRFGAMQIITFIPLFNWLVWVFAWLDTRKPRYLAYGIIYLAPYLSTGLSISPDDSWLPLASVLACIVHVQLDITVTSEGIPSPLSNVSKILGKKSQTTDLREHADELFGRLKGLSDSAVDSVDGDKEPIDRNEDRNVGHKEDMEFDSQQREFEDWDKKLAKSYSKEKVVSETDT